MDPCGSLEDPQIPKSRDALLKIFKFIKQVCTYSLVQFTLRFVNLFGEVSRVCAMAPPNFDRAVNPKSTRGADYAPTSISTSGFSDLPIQAVQIRIFRSFLQIHRLLQNCRTATSFFLTCYNPAILQEFAQRPQSGPIVQPFFQWSRPLPPPIRRPCIKHKFLKS